MNTNAKLTAYNDIQEEYPFVHATDSTWDNYVSTVNHLFTTDTTHLNQQLGL